VAHHAGDAVFIEGPVQSRVAREGTGKQRDRIMAAFAMARVLDSLLHD